MRATSGKVARLFRAVGLLAGLLLGEQASRAQNPGPPPRVIVADVFIRGNRLVSSQEIQAQLKTHALGEYSEAVVQDDVRTLYATRKYANVEAVPLFSVDGKEVTVTFYIRDHSGVVRNVLYKGNKHLSQDDLEGLTGIRRGQPLNPIANKIACQAIVRKLNEQGRPFAECHLESGANSDDSDVIFAITEGEKVLVSGIDFVVDCEGNSQPFVSNARLATLLNSSAGFYKLFRGTYNSLMVDADIAKLEEYYRSFGYLDVRIARELQYVNSGLEVYLIFHVKEGQRYHVKDAPQFTGAKSMPPEALEHLSAVKALDFYDETKVKKDTEAIKDWYGKQGQDVRVVTTPIFSRDDPGVVTVHYEIEEKQPARVGQIIIYGNDRTRQNVILRQLEGIYPGQIIDYPAMRQSERNLAKLGIFEVGADGGVRPTVSLADPEGDSPFKDVIVNVQETNTGSLLFGVGVNSDAGLTGSIVLNERNFDITRVPTSFDDLFSGGAFRGAGQEFRAEAVPGTSLQRYTVNFREPFLFDTNYSLNVGAYYYDRQYDDDVESRLGFRVGVGHKLNQYWTASLTARVEDVGIHSVPAYAPEDYQSVVGDNLLVGLRAGLTRDDRDSYLRPTEGSLLDLSYEQCFGDFTFPLVNIDFNKYFTVYQRPDGSGRQVLAVHSQVSWAGSNTPTYERYFAGGFRSIRGFAFRGVSPTVDFQAVGGTFMLLNSVEYQIPLRANDQIYFVGFVDSGTVESKVELRDYRVSAGVGVRFTVPMLGPVPIALDFGFPLVKGPEDKTQVFSFWLGFFR
jgi:outer membrane protein assembly complex protein YaeT